MNYGLFSRVISCHDRLAQNCQNSCSKCAPYTQTKALRRRRISSRSSIAQERNRCRVLDVLYADDILLLTPTVSELQNLLNTCERELQALDLVINVKKSCCLRIGPRNDVNCERLCSLSGTLLPWTKEVKYLGIYLVSSKRFKISTEHSRRSFYRAANAIFGRIGRIATEEVVLTHG